MAAVPDGWVDLDEAVNVLGVPNAIGGVSTTIGPRTTQGLRIKVTSEHAGLFDHPREEAWGC